MSRFQNAVIVSRVAYDPLVGLAGSPNSLVRNLLADSMAESFKARKNNRPAPGVQGGPLKVAASAAASITATSVELVASSEGMAGVHTGSINEAFEKAVTQFQSISSVYTDPAKCAIIIAANDRG